MSKSISFHLSKLCCLKQSQLVPQGLPNHFLESTFSISLFIAPTSGCDLITSEGKCFSYFYNYWINWYGARGNCQTWGGHLASIDSASENEALLYIVSRFSCWIGLNDRETEGTFVWLDGSNSLYRNWAPDELNSRRENEDCCDNNWSQFRWSDQSCNAGRRCSICSSRNGKLINNQFYMRSLTL